MSTLYAAAMGIVPFIGMFTAFGTVLKCYLLCKQQGKLPPGFVFPAISALGTAHPEKRFYQLGFSTAGIFVAITTILVGKFIGPHILLNRTGKDLAFAQEQLASMTRTGLVMAAGTALQGIFTLELQMSMQSIIHWAGAMAFMYGAMTHANITNELYEDSSVKFPSPLFQTPALAYSLSFKKLCLQVPLMMFVLPLLMQVFSRQGAQPPVEPVGPIGSNTVADRVSVPALSLPQISSTSSRELKKRLAGRKVDFSRALEKSDLEELYLKDLTEFPDKEEYTASTVQNTEQSKPTTPTTPTNKKTDEPEPDLMQGGGPAENGMGLMQWLLIGAFVLYFGSYGVDVFMAISSGSAHIKSE